LVIIFYFYFYFLKIGDIMKTTKQQIKNRIDLLNNNYNNHNTLKNILNNNSNKIYSQNKNIKTNSKNNYFVYFKNHLLIVNNSIIIKVIDRRNKSNNKIGYTRAIKTFHSKDYKIKNQHNYIHTLNNYKNFNTCEKNLIGLKFRAVSKYLNSILGQYTIKKYNPNRDITTF